MGLILVSVSARMAAVFFWRSSSLRVESARRARTCLASISRMGSSLAFWSGVTFSLSTMFWICERGPDWGAASSAKAKARAASFFMCAPSLYIEMMAEELVECHLVLFGKASGKFFHFCRRHGDEGLDDAHVG